MEKGWVKVYSTPRLHEAEIVKAILEDNEIPAVIFNKKDSSYLDFGEIEVYVKNTDALNAAGIINKVDFE